MFRLMHRVLDRGEKVLLRGHRFLGDVHYYWWTCRHSFRRSIELARDTIYP